MADYLLPLIDRKEIADKTWAFWFDIRGTDFRFKAGQNADFGVGDVRTFSVASSPNNHDAIMIAMRRVDGSDFKKHLMSMPMGEVMRVQGPAGDFVLPKKSDRHIVMLAGGIGITPFLSMITYATEEKLPHEITLIFGNSSVKRATFVHELETFKLLNSNFKLTLVYEHLTKNIIRPQQDAKYFLAGPPGFVSGVRAILDESEVDEDNIRTEEFSGY